MAAATILILPTVLVYLAFERTFVKGMTLTGVKG
jgi:ABC-type glycerol-3-phosphate transport system permease component